MREGEKQAELRALKERIARVTKAKQARRDVGDELSSDPQSDGMQQNEKDPYQRD